METSFNSSAFHPAHLNRHPLKDLTGQSRAATYQADYSYKLTDFVGFLLYLTLQVQMIVIFAIFW